MLWSFFLLLTTFHEKIKAEKLQVIGLEIENKANISGAKRVACPITATYSVKGDLMDIELLLSIDN